MHSHQKMRALALCTVAALSASGAKAATVSMTFNDDLSGAAPGSATLTVQDIGTNEVQVTLTPNFSGSSVQTITGLWLNDPGLTGETVTAVSPSPNPFVSTTYTATQTTSPSTSLAGQYDTYVKFNNGSGALIRGTTAETFDITSTGGALSAASFNLADAPGSGGTPNNFYGLIGLTNYSGVAGSGVGYIAATSATFTPVPLPAAFPLLFSGLGALGAAVRRRKSTVT